MDAAPEKTFWKNAGAGPRGCVSTREELAPSSKRTGSLPEEGLQVRFAASVCCKYDLDLFVGISAVLVRMVVQHVVLRVADGVVFGGAGTPLALYETVRARGGLAGEAEDHAGGAKLGLALSGLWGPHGRLSDLGNNPS